MKILYVSTISNTVNAFLIPHIEMLVKKGYQVDIACKVTQDINPKLIELGCNIHDIKFSRNPLSLNNYISYKQIKNLLYKNKYNIVHTHTPVASFISRLSCRNKKEVKVFYTAHGFHFFKGASIVNWLIYYSIEKISSKWTSTLITINDEDYKNAHKFKKNNHQLSLYKIPGVGINLDKFKSPSFEEKQNLRQQYGFKHNDFILIYVAEMTVRKNQKLLIQSIALLEEKIPNMQVLLVGEGPLLDKYKTLVIDLNLSEIISFLGYRNDVNTLMKISDVAVSTSKQEGLPVNVMEAMATGLPIVVSDCRGNRDLINNNGFVVDNDEFQFSKAIETIYHSRDLRKKFSKESEKTITDYSVENVLDFLEGLYVEDFEYESTETGVN